MFQSAGRIIGWLKVPEAEAEEGIGGVSIRRADYWLVEASHADRCAWQLSAFQSAGRIIGWLKYGTGSGAIGASSQFQSAGRIIGWLKHCATIRSSADCGDVSIRRADYWLVEDLA